LKPPTELNILSGETLSGKPLPLHRDGGQIHLDYCFGGSSEILVFQLSDGSATTQARSVPEFGDYANFKKEILAPYEAEYLKLATAHQQDQALQSFSEQLELLDEVVARLIRILRPFKVTSLDSLLGDIKINPADGSLTESHAITTNALDVLFDYQDLAHQPSSPEITEQEQRALGEYYEASLKAAQDYIARQVEPLTIMHDSNLGQILPVSVVIQFLHIPDSQWSPEEIESLPKWTQQSEYLKILEEFSLQARRPLTAYHFALYQRKLNDGTLDKFDYLAKAAARMINNRDYLAGISCLKAAITAASGESQREVLVDLRLKLAEVLESTGQVQLAADEAKQAMDEFPQSGQYGKAAALRLKYLYEMSRFPDILQEAPKYQTDDRCKSYLPQILYTSWVAHRHEKQLEAADALEKTFLSRFPDHPLGVHMHFASAMDALAASNYEEALRLLKIIEQLYPDSKIMSNVKEIKERLEKSATIPKAN